MLSWLLVVALAALLVAALIAMLVGRRRSSYALARFMAVYRRRLQLAATRERKLRARLRHTEASYRIRGDDIRRLRQFRETLIRELAAARRVSPAEQQRALVEANYYGAQRQMRSMFNPYVSARDISAEHLSLRTPVTSELFPDRGVGPASQPVVIAPEKKEKKPPSVLAYKPGRVLRILHKKKEE